MFQWDEGDPLALAEGESAKANQGLHDYAGLGAGRSLRLLCERYEAASRDQAATTPRPPTVRLATLKEWSTSFEWGERVRAWEDEERKRERAAAAAVREQRAAELADRNWDLSEKLASRVIEMLGFPLAQVEQVTRRRQSDDGRTTEIHMNVVKPAKWSFQTAAIMADIAAKLGALSAGEATDRTAHTLDLSKRELEEMPLDQLLALRAQVERGGR